MADANASPVLRQPASSEVPSLLMKNIDGVRVHIGSQRGVEGETLAALRRGFKALRVLRPSLLRPASHPYP